MQYILALLLIFLPIQIELALMLKIFWDWKDGKEAETCFASLRESCDRSSYSSFD